MNNIKNLRAKQGLTLERLGEMAGGMSKGQIYMLENDKQTPKITTAYAIAAALGVDVYEVWPDDTKVVEEVVTIRKVVRHA